MQEFTKIIKEDMKEALGVTEPGAISFAVSKAKSYIKEPIEEIKVRLNSGIYKNGFTCGIPNTKEVGNEFAAALGVIAGKSEKELKALEDITKEDIKRAKKLVEEGKIKIELNKVSSDIFIEAIIRSKNEKVNVKIEKKHTNISEIILNDNLIFKNSKNEEENEEESKLKDKTLKEILDYVNTVEVNEIEFLKSAYCVNLNLFREGKKSKRTVFLKQFLKRNEKILSKNPQETAQLLCCGAIEARVLGLNKPAMSITGSGAHGIITTLPLYAEYKIKKDSREKLYRATMLSYLICTYIKEFSGRLSAFCGCAIAGGIGAACGLGYLKGATYEEIIQIINIMTLGIPGMICDGGNHGCVMKGMVAVDSIYRSVEMALNGIEIKEKHGIIGNSIEETMKNIGKIASPGMKETERVIVEILNKK